MAFTMRTTSFELMDSPEASGPSIATETTPNTPNSPVITIGAPTTAEEIAPTTPATAQPAITAFN